MRLAGTTRRILLASLGAAALCGALVPAAHANEPWWSMTSGARPADLHSGAAANEVQEITIASGTLFCLATKGIPFACFGAPESGFPDATTTSLREGLEGAYGAGDVEVTGGPAGSSPFIVTSVNGAADRAVHALEFIALVGSGATKVLDEGKPDGQIILTAENLGDESAQGAGEPIVLKDTLPPNLEAVGIEGIAGEKYPGTFNRGPVNCSLAQLECTFENTLYPYEQIEVRIAVVVDAGASTGEINEASVAGGGGRQARIARAVNINDASPTFGVEDYEMSLEEEGGVSTTQAGAHPFQLTTVLSVNQNSEEKPIGLPKDLSFKLPPGLLGDPTQLPQCTDAQFAKVTEGINECPAQTAIGVATVTINEPENLGGLDTLVVPVFNLKPAVGEPAKFGFEVEKSPVAIDTSVRTGSDYGITVSVPNITQTASFLSSKVTFWGVPGDPRHDDERGWNCVGNELWRFKNETRLAPCTALGEAKAPPFLSLPTSCTGPLQTTVESDSWEHPEDVQVTGNSAPLPSLDGCDRLLFEPEISVTPDVSQASSPSGLLVKVHVDQESALNPHGLAEATVKDTTVVLPEGLTINPAGADGLEACSMSQIGYLAEESSGESLKFTPEQPACPNGSKVGTVEIETPLLPNKLEGAVYLGTQNENPFGSLIAMYIVARDPVSGTLVKLPGEVSLNQTTGQLTSTFKNTPELPFEDLRLHFFGGARAPLSTPPLCGSYRTEASFTPWSGNPAVEATSEFQTTTGPNGAPCADPQPFAPGFDAGSTNIQAGAFTPFTTSLSRPDSDQPLGALSMTLPPGLLGSLSAVKLCPEPQAQLGQCGPESLIGHTVVSAGLGSNPVTVKREGEVFITEGYEGAPYGLSIVNPAEAGPFNLGDVVVRAKIEVDPRTAQLKVTSDPFPTILQGIPLQLQHINVAIDRPGFTFNPTNCSAMAITATIASAEGANAHASSPFQVTNCAALPFKPVFTAMTKARHTRKDGAYLQVRVTSSAGQADIAKAKVELPKALPSELKTLQQACTEAQFDANPAGCPEASDVGTVVVHTPVLPVPLTGPAYFVSRGTQWPELVMVLKGYGVTVDLAGETHISKQGVTSTTLSSVPDVPFTSFTLTLPEGPHSALAGNGNLCKKALIMPIKLTGQNGALLTRKTKIKVSGCPKTKVKRKAQKRRKKRNRKHENTSRRRTR